MCHVRGDLFLKLSLIAHIGKESLLVRSMCVFNQGTGNYNLGNELTKSTRTSHTSQCKNVANVILEHFI